jgi:mannose-6-phosphate isomerase-like protein (cupin superfamily)
MTASIIHRDTLRISPTAETAKFEGYAHGGAKVSFLWSSLPDGIGGASLHRHPYIETFVMLEGDATFTIGSHVVTLTAGQIAVAPANTPHKFANVGAGRLQVLGIHPNDRVIQEDLEEGGSWVPHEDEDTIAPIILNARDLHEGELEGQRHGNPSISFIWVDAAPGEGPGLHRHPYTEVFVVLEGHPTFTVGAEVAELSAGQIAIAPANTPHKFVNSGEGRLRQLDIHTSGTFITEWLEG